MNLDWDLMKECLSKSERLASKNLLKSSDLTMAVPNLDSGMQMKLTRCVSWAKMASKPWTRLREDSR
jgi:hypothetical protein